MQPYIFNRLLTSFEYEWEIKYLARITSQKGKNLEKKARIFYQDAFIRESFDFAYCGFALL